MKKKSSVFVLISDNDAGTHVDVYLNIHDAQSAFIGMVLEDENVSRLNKTDIRASKDHAVRFDHALDAYSAAHDDGLLDYSYYIEQAQVK